MDQARSATAVFRRISTDFKIISTRALGSTIRTRASVPGPGAIKQYATRSAGGKRLTACRVEIRKIALAGKSTLYCHANPATTAARAKGPVAIRICTRYRPTNGTPRTRCRHTTLPALKPAFTG